MIQLHPYPTFLCIGLLVLQACSTERPPNLNSIPEVIIDVSPSAEITEADQLKYDQQYAKAAGLYVQELAKSSLDRNDSLRLINQIAYCWLMLDKKDLAQPWLNEGKLLYQAGREAMPEKISADHAYNRGRYAYLNHQFEEAQQYIHLALQGFQKLYPNNHLKIGQCFSLLSLLHYEKGLVSDSTAYYALQANDVFSSQKELFPYQWECDFAMACASLLDRAHFRGANYCKSALEKLERLPEAHPLMEARCLSMWGNMLKKQGDTLSNHPDNEEKKMRLYSMADSLCFSQAIQTADPLAFYRVQEFHRDRIINSARFKENTLFFRYLSELDSLLQEHDQQHVYPDRLLGYFYMRHNIDSSTYYYQKFLKTCEQEESCNIYLLDEAFFILRIGFLSSKQYDKALTYALKAMELFNCCPANLNFKSPEFIGQLERERTPCLNYYGMMAEVLLQKYLSSQQKDDLLLALDYFSIYEQNFFPSILRADEDALLTFQYEISTQTFLNALKAAYYAYQDSQDTFFLDKAFGYMERIKSYLLYRDRLNPSRNTQEDISRSDSIRLLQGRINRLQFMNDQSPETQQQLNRTQSALTSLLRKRRQDSTAYKQLIEQELPNIKSIQNKLDSNQALVQYANNRGNLFIIYVDKANSKFLSVKDTGLLETSLSFFRNSFESKFYGRTAKMNYNKSAHPLYQILVGPYEAYLKNIEELIIIPDNGLDHIPFEALLQEKIPLDPGKVDYRNLPYLGRKKEVIYSPAWKVYEANLDSWADRSTDRLSLGVWSDPELEAPLSTVRKSIAELEARFDPVFFQKGKHHFLDHAENFDLLFLWMHASSSRINRHQNQIYFGGTQNDTLFGFELSAHSFPIDLLVLGSCESVYGAAQKGEGTFSLTRSFLHAGVPQVLATLWRVSSQTSAELLALFFQHLGNKKAPYQALRQAKLQFIEQAPASKDAFPGYWAGFILTK